MYSTYVSSNSLREARQVLGDGPLPGQGSVPFGDSYSRRGRRSLGLFLAFSLLQDEEITREGIGREMTTAVKQPRGGGWEAEFTKNASLEVCWLLVEAWAREASRVLCLMVYGWVKSATLR